MAVGHCNYDYAHLPNAVWLRILSYADTDALLAIEATAPRFNDIVRDERLAAKIVCAPSSDERTLQQFFTKRVMRNVKVLDVSNCIVAAPDFILSWVGTCHTLTELRCVSCPLPYSALLVVLMEWLPYLQRLDWSFYGENFGDDYTHRVTAPYNDRAIPQLRSTYVEVACEGLDNYALLGFLLNRCVVLQNLHLHALYGEFTETTAMCIGMTTFATASITTLIYSTELDAVRGQRSLFNSFVRVLEVPSNCLSDATVCGNLVCLRASTAGASSSHTHAMHPCFKQVVVALSNEANVESKLQEAAIAMTLPHVEALTLTFLPYAESDTAACAGPKFKTPLVTFLSSFRHITELNLNSFHFTGGVDCCNVLSAVPMKLKALSLAPCGINRAHSFRNLAKVSSKLEELDVRMNFDNVSLYCASCRQPFRVREEEAALLQQHSALKRFSLCNVPKVTSLNFIAQLRPTELRLSFMAWHTDTVTGNIGYLLSCNDNLRSLVLRDRALFRGLEFYQEELEALTGLNHLSLDVSMPSEQNEVLSFYEHMTAQLPVLKALHLHYSSGEKFVRTLTWLRQPTWCSENCKDRQPPGALLADGPCIGCSMATFIGLAKPRHHRNNFL
ncbi:uncharacterized protein LOC144157845 [Haemaphysalis longicornis]